MSPFSSITIWYLHQLVYAAASKIVLNTIEGRRTHQKPFINLSFILSWLLNCTMQSAINVLPILPKSLILIIWSMDFEFEAYLLQLSHPRWSFVTLWTLFHAHHVWHPIHERNPQCLAYHKHHERCTWKSLYPICLHNG